MPLTMAHLPSHTHRIIASVMTGKDTATGREPNGTFIADINPAPPNNTYLYSSKQSAAPNRMANGMVEGTTTTYGQGVPFPVMQPFIGLSGIICCQGYFPQRG